MGLMRRQTAAEARTKIVRKQSVWWGLQKDLDERDVGEYTKSGIRRNPAVYNWVPRGDRMTYRRAMEQYTANTALDVTYKPLAIAQGWDGSLLTMFLSPDGSNELKLTVQETDSALPSVISTLTVDTSGISWGDIDGRWHTLNRDRLIFVSNIPDSPIIQVHKYVGVGPSYAVSILENQNLGLTDSVVASTAPSSTQSYHYKLAYSFAIRSNDTDLLIHQTPFQTIDNLSADSRDLRIDVPFGSGAYSLKLGVTPPVGEFGSYNKVRVWRTLNYSTDTGDPNADAAAGSDSLYYLLAEVDIADLATTELWNANLDDGSILGGEQAVFGYSNIPASAISAISPGFFLSASENRVYYTAIGATFSRLGQYYEAAQFYDYDNDITSLTQSNGWLLVTTSRACYRWDLVTASDAGLFGTTASIGISIPVLGTPLQASGDFGVASIHDRTLSVGSNGYILGMFSDTSIRYFDGATFSEDFTQGYIKTTDLSQPATTGATGVWLPTGEYVLWLTNVSYMVQFPANGNPVMWTEFGDDRDGLFSDQLDWQTPSVRPIYLPYGNDFCSGGQGRLIIVRAAGGTDQTGYTKLWTWSTDYICPASEATHYFTLGEMTANEWWRYVRPEEGHIYTRNLSEDAAAYTAQIVGPDGIGYDVTATITDGGQVTWYPPNNVGDTWQSFSIVWSAFGGDLVLSRADAIIESIERNKFPTLDKFVAKLPFALEKPLVQVLTGLGPLMVAGGDTSTTDYGLFEGVNCTVYGPTALDSTVYTITGDNPFYGPSYPVLTVAEGYSAASPQESFLSKNTGFPGVLSSSRKSRGLFLPSALADTTVNFGQYTGTPVNPLELSGFTIGFWHKRDTDVNFGEYTLFSLGSTFKFNLEKTDANTERFHIGNVAETWGVWDDSFTHVPGGAFAGTWRYYLMRCTHTETSDGVYTEEYTLYTATVGGSITLVNSVLLTNQANRNENLFWWKEKDVNIYGEDGSKIWDLCIFDYLDVQTIWDLKGNADNVQRLYNSNNYPTPGQGN